MEKKYQVFISSTFEDLRVERDKVRDTILALGHLPVGMESFGATSDETWKTIKETIDTSDYYILIIGQRYGTVIDKGLNVGVSFTEREFIYACEQDVPVLAFLIDDNTAVKPGNVEKEHVKEFKSFIERVKKDRQVVWWENPDDLAAKVSTSLVKEIKRKPRFGWIRGTSERTRETSSAEFESLRESYANLKREYRGLEKKYSDLSSYNAHLLEDKDALEKKCSELVLKITNMENALHAMSVNTSTQADGLSDNKTPDTKNAVKDTKLRKYLFTVQYQLVSTWKTCEDETQFSHEAYSLYQLMEHMDEYIPKDSGISRTIMKKYNAYMQSVRAYRAFAPQERQSPSAESSKIIARKRFDEFYDFMDKYA